MVAVRGSCCFVSSCRISHFGIKPVSGGRPPRDSRVSIVVTVITGVFDQVRANVLIFVVIRYLNVMKAVPVIMM